MADQMIRQIGKPFHAEITSADASAGVAVALTEPDAPETSITLAATEQLQIHFAMIRGDAAEPGDLFFDQQGLASALAIAAADDSGNTFTVAGDRATEFRAGRVFNVANSTGNDGAYVSTGAVYSSGGDTTTISVASVADGTDDGDITSEPTPTAGYIVLGSENAPSQPIPQSAYWPVEAPRKGPPGYVLYFKSAAFDESKAIVDGVIRKPITRTP